jgi:hypothetical protein
MKIVESEWLGRSLQNYKEMQEGVSKSKGVYDDLKKAKTLTEARKIVYGYKKGNKDKKHG